MCCLSAILFTSCGIATGVNATGYEPTHAEVHLRDNNFKVVGMARGEWSATYVLGIGGFSKEVLLNNAISDMYEKANLKGSQAIINVTNAVSIRSIAWGLYTERTVIVTGTIIEFTK